MEILLISFYLYQTDISSESAKVIAKHCMQLVFLSLSETRVTGTPLTEIRKLPQLRALCIPGTLIRSCGCLRNLNHLVLDGLAQEAQSASQVMVELRHYGVDIEMSEEVLAEFYWNCCL
jgi:hypothetical protein